MISIPCASGHRPLQAAARVPFVDSLPKNHYGKVLKTELRAHSLWIAAVAQA